MTARGEINSVPMPPLAGGRGRLFLWLLVLTLLALVLAASLAGDPSLASLIPVVRDFLGR